MRALKSVAGVVGYSLPGYRVKVTIAKTTTPKYATDTCVCEIASAIS